ncbi:MULTISPECIES: peptide IlvX [unclassified Enterobacter]
MISSIKFCFSRFTTGK